MLRRGTPVGPDLRPYDARVTERYDIAVIGAGAAGEAAAHYAGSRGAKVAIVERDLFGGGCPFWQCMPSKALLHAAAVHHAGGDYSWQRASDFRDWMISREGIDYPDDSGHVKALQESGATPIRGTGRFIGLGQLEVTPSGAAADGNPVALEADQIILAVGSHAKIPDLPGLDGIEYWTNRQGTGTRRLPDGLVILGGGPSGVELSQVYARYGVAVTIVHPKDRIHDRDHPRSSDYLGKGLERDGVTLRLNARATGIRPRAGTNGRHVVDLSDGSSAEGEAIMLTIGRDVPLEDLNLGAIGVEPQDGRVKRDDRLRIAPNVFVAGDIAGPELHTHLGHYEGEMAAMLALGDDVRPDLRPIPRATYTDPETASVGLMVEQAREKGIDAVEFTQDIAKSARGEVIEAQGHVTIVVDRANRTLVGAFMAGPAVSETIHEAVLAVKTGISIDVLADTIHAFPTTSRVLGTAFIEAARTLPKPA
jgi:pyruvate/2-oxoglutarate dehydrogenase complex dihydrolipoamide dehydrogenase (E3) component